MADRGLETTINSLVRTGLRRFRYLYYHGDVQRRSASRARLTGRRAYELTFHIDIRRYRMGAHRTVHMALRLVHRESLHIFPLPIRTREHVHGLYQNRENCAAEACENPLRGVLR